MECFFVIDSNFFGDVVDISFVFDDGGAFW